MGRRSHFTPAQKRDAVLGVLTKRKTVSETCRELGISEQTLARWREQAVEGMELALADKTERDAREALLEKKLTEAEQTIGRLAMENDLLGKASRRLT
jgi:transposase-like protein